MDGPFPWVILVNRKNGASVEGELVLEHDQHFQVAVAGEVGAFSKTEWFRSNRNQYSPFADIFGGF